MKQEEEASRGAAVLWFWGAPLAILVVASIVPASAPGSEELGGAAVFLLWLPVWCVITFLSAIGFLVVISQYRIAKQVKRRLFICSACAGIVSCGLPPSSSTLRVTDRRGHGSWTESFTNGKLLSSLRSTL